jgi:hypothetical protein
MRRESAEGEGWQRGFLPLFSTEVFVGLGWWVFLPGWRGGMGMVGREGWGKRWEGWGPGGRRAWGHGMKAVLLMRRQANREA